MSYEADPSLAPNSPKAKSSSSTIYEAFRTLTSNKSKKSASALVSPTLVDSSPSLSSGDPSVHDMDHGIQSRRRDVTAIHTGVPAGSIRTSGFVGGPPHLPQVLNHLRPGNTIKLRLQAARETAVIVEKYPLQDVESIWAMARDLVDKPEEEGAVETAYGLLFACVKHNTLTARERIVFLDALATDSRHVTVGYRIRILKALTIEARYLDHLETSVTSLLVTLLMDAYKNAPHEREQEREQSQAAKPDSQKEPISLDQAFEYTLALLKFNGSILPDTDIAQLLAQTLAICTKTGTKSDIKNCVDIIDTVATYSLIPESQLCDCLQLLCSIVAMIESQAAKATATIHKIMNSHFGPATTDMLLSIIRDSPEATSKNYARGAVVVVHGLLTLPDTDNMVIPTAAEFWSAIADSFRNSNALDSITFLPRLMRVILGILQSKETVSMLSDPTAWADFSLILTRCWQKQGFAQQKLKRESGTPQILSEQVIREKKGLEQALPVSVQIIQRLLQLSDHKEFDDDAAVMELILRMSAPEQIDDETATSLINGVVNEAILQPPSETWLDNCRMLHRTIFKDLHRVRSVRLLCLKALSDAYNTAEAVNIPDADTVVLELASNIPFETDALVAESLCGLIMNVGTWTDDDNLFESLLQKLFAALPLTALDKSSSSRPSSHSSSLSNSVSPGSECGSHHEIQRMVVTGFVSLFLRVLRRSAWKAQRLYTVLLQIAECSSVAAVARLAAFKLLLRLRADVNYSIFIIADPGCETLAAALCRTKHTYKEEPNILLDSPISRPLRPDESLPKRKNQSTPVAATHGRNGNVTRSASRATRPAAPAPPAWMYFSIKALPEDPPHVASHLLLSHRDDSLKDADVSPTDVPQPDVLRITTWIELVISLLQQKDLDWEILSYLVVHLGAQLTNHSLFVDAIPHVRLLRNILCSQLLNKTFMEPPASTGLKKGDVAVCLYDILTMLVSYRAHFAKGESEEMVKVFVLGIGERTSEFCIHALSICCVELPEPVRKILDSVLQKMTQIITQTSVAVHVLEFLAALARLPELFLQFREPEYKTVFAICFRYLQFVRDQRKKLTIPGAYRSNSKSPAPNSRINRDSGVQLDIPKQDKSLADELPQYVYALAYHVITFFFMSLKLKYRAQYLEWIAQNLTYRGEDGRDVMEEQGEVTVDYMRRIAYTDRDETAYDSDFAKLSDGTITKKSWILGSELMTIETAGRSGLSQLTRRRPSGTKYTVVQPKLVTLPRHQVPITYGSAADAFYSTDYIGVTPEDVMQEMYSQFPVVPVPLPDDESTLRSIGLIDRISPLDGHKVGIIYIGEGQSDEKAILANVMGSEDYTAFLNSIGTLTRLKGATFNTQGLDREFDSDGKFTYCWRNRVTELVFHIPTLMPTDLPNDPQCSRKKAHTGNDFVNIIFNNSGLPFQFNTFPSAFNWVNIEIVPEARTSFVGTRMRAAEMRQQNHGLSNGLNQNSYFSSNPLEVSEPLTTIQKALDLNEAIYSNLYYKVTVHVKPDLPFISPAAETKMLSGSSLPTFVRLIALNASVFAHVWASKESGEQEPPSSWRSRQREIARLRERHAVAMPRLIVRSIPTISEREVANNSAVTNNAELPAGPFTASLSAAATPGTAATTSPLSALVATGNAQHTYDALMSPMPPLHLTNPPTPGIPQPPGATITLSTTNMTAMASARESGNDTGSAGGLNKSTSGGAAGLLRRMSQAAFGTDGGSAVGGSSGSASSSEVGAPPTPAVPGTPGIGSRHSLIKNENSMQGHASGRDSDRDRDSMPGSRVSRA